MLNAISRMSTMELSKKSDMTSFTSCSRKRSVENAAVMKNLKMKMTTTAVIIHFREASKYDGSASATWTLLKRRMKACKVHPSNSVVIKVDTAGFSMPLKPNAFLKII